MSTEPEEYQLDPDVGPGEELRDSQGRVVDDAYVEDAVAHIRGRGRPSLLDFEQLSTSHDRMPSVAL